MPDTNIVFTPASEVTERHALVVALEAPPNAGKTYSACRLAKGMAEAQGKRFAVADTEGGRTLHLRNKFDFDVTMIGPPHTPDAYLRVAQAAQAAGKGALVIDSFSNVWRGIGGVLHWADEELQAYVDRQREFAESKGWKFNEDLARNKGKQSSLIRPKTAFKFMMAGLLDLRMPIILSIRGEVNYDAESKKEMFKAHMQKGIGFDVTCRFRLMPDKKGVIDISDSEKFKMEGDHAAIFKHGALLTEAHGAALEAWSRNAAFDQQQSTGGSKAAALEQQKQQPPDPEAEKMRARYGDVRKRVAAATADDAVDAITQEPETQEMVVWLLKNAPDSHKKLFDEIINPRRLELRKAAPATTGGLL